jgi:tetratricopeptide (TPR) repeat protein
VTTAQVVAIALVVLPALAFALWPLVGGRREAGVPSPRVAPTDAARELSEEKAAVYRALKELAFDHEAGHLSDDDYAGLRARYESRAAEILAALDALGPVAAVVTATEQPRAIAETVPPVDRPAMPDSTATGAAPAAPAPRTRATLARHPAVVAAGAVALVLFGVVLGLNAGRFTEPDQTMTPPGSRIPVPVMPDAPRTMPPVAGVEPGKPIPPGMLAGMLEAARASLAAQRYSEAIAAYQAVLKRDAKNVDAMTHLGLIVAIGGHADTALEAFDQALAIDPKYAPAYLYQGQVLYEVKRDYPAAVKAWEQFLALVPSGEEHQRVADLVKDARTRAAR